jgi:4-hydroxy-tetrahydrodipicolinate reductase
MRIALIGYGRMGKEIEKTALSRGHEISLRIDRENTHEIDLMSAANTDVAVEFSTPGSVIANLLYCFRSGIPVVCGTTGWHERLKEVTDACAQAGGSLVHASNFSIGVNLFFEMNNYLARLMDAHPDYEVSIREVHHVNKLDAPSGTAISLASGIMEHSTTKKSWFLAEGETNAMKDKIPVHAERTGTVTGLHEVSYTSGTDMITLRHEAFNRSGFALGAVKAAEWIVTRQGSFTMRDVLFGEQDKSEK